MSRWKALSIIGLLFDLLGAFCLGKGLFIRTKTALQLGQAYYSGDSDEENLKLPPVQDRLRTRNWAVVGAVLLAFGFSLQIFSVLTQ